MSEASRSQVTITLGRTGQVVKRAGRGLDRSFTEPHPVSGNKRSVRERLGNVVDLSVPYGNKRLRGDVRTPTALDGILSKDDLRHKIMKKNVMKQSQSSQQNGVDLRSILSRPAQSSTNSILTRETREQMPDTKDKRQQFMEPMDTRQPYSKEARDYRPLMPVTRNSSQQMQEYRSQRLPDYGEQHMVEEKGGGRRVPEVESARRHLPESNSSMMARGTVLRATNPVAKVESGFDPSSPWTLDRLRRKSPDEALATSRRFSAATRDEELQRRYTVRSYDDAKASTFTSKDSFDFSRPTTSSSFLTKAAPPVGSVKTRVPVNTASVPLSSSVPQRSAYVVDDRQSVESFLRSLGLEKYAILFKVEEVDMYSLKRMSEIDLKEMGIPMGPRKKILLSLHPRLRGQA